MSFDEDEWTYQPKKPKKPKKPKNFLGRVGDNWAKKSGLEKVGSVLDSLTLRPLFAATAAEMANVNYPTSRQNELNRAAQNLKDPSYALQHKGQTPEDIVGPYAAPYPDVWERVASGDAPLGSEIAHKGQIQAGLKQKGDPITGLDQGLGFAADMLMSPMNPLVGTAGGVLGRALKTGSKAFSKTPVPTVLKEGVRGATNLAIGGAKRLDKPFDIKKIGKGMQRSALKGPNEAVENAKFLDNNKQFSKLFEKYKKDLFPNSKTNLKEAMLKNLPKLAEKIAKKRMKLLDPISERYNQLFKQNPNAVPTLRTIKENSEAWNKSQAAIGDIKKRVLGIEGRENLLKKFEQLQEEIFDFLSPSMKTGLDNKQVYKSLDLNSALYRRRELGDLVNKASKTGGSTYGSSELWKNAYKGVSAVVDDFIIETLKRTPPNRLKAFAKMNNIKGKATPENIMKQIQTYNNEFRVMSSGRDAANAAAKAGGDILQSSGGNIFGKVFDSVVSPSTLHRAGRVVENVGNTGDRAIKQTLIRKSKSEDRNNFTPLKNEEWFFKGSKVE